MNSPDKTKRDGMLARIRALMAKTTDNGCTEAEAAEAARKVDELMALYEIDLDEVSMRQQDILQASVSGVFRHPVHQAAWRIARFTDCKVWFWNGADVVYLGFQVDTEIAEYLTILFRRAIDRESAAYTLFNPAYDAASKGSRAEMVRSFGIGMARRLSERLRDLKSKRDFTTRVSTGRDLVMMKAPAIEDAFAKLGIILGKGKPDREALNKAAFEAGQEAARHVAINQGVAGRAARQDGWLV